MIEPIKGGKATLLLELQEIAEEVEKEVDPKSIEALRIKVKALTRKKKRNKV